MAPFDAASAGLVALLPLPEQPFVDGAFATADGAQVAAPGLANPITAAIRIGPTMNRRPSRLHVIHWR